MGAFSVKIIFVCFLCSVTESANILAITPAPFYSHASNFRPLWRELARRGHHVTLVTMNLMEKNENITQIDLSTPELSTVKNDIVQMIQYGNKTLSILQRLRIMVDKFSQFMIIQLKNTDLQAIKDREQDKFDLVMSEVYFSWFNALSAKFRCPLVALSSMNGMFSIHNVLGNAVHPSIYPAMEQYLDRSPPFTERLKNTMAVISQGILIPLLYNYMDAYVEEYIGKQLPTINELQHSTSLLLLNSNPIFYAVRPSTPITVDVSGLHIGKPQPLPKDLQDYLDESIHGCIYFSLGSTVNSDSLGPKVVEIFRKTFEELQPVNVLWKYENTTLPNKPKNLKIKKWMPQQDILRHPNVKMFITQGGLQSMEEAIDSAVPMLGIPFYGDQITNVKIMVNKKFGVSLNIDQIDEVSLKNSILELMQNPIYQKNIDRLSAISKDQPMTSLERAVWWTEYVLRHNGTQHLRSPSADIPYYQYFFLDIIAFFIVLFILIGVVVYYSIKLIKITLRKIFFRSKQKIQ